MLSWDVLSLQAQKNGPLLLFGGRGAPHIDGVALGFPVEPGNKGYQLQKTAACIWIPVSTPKGAHAWSVSCCFFERTKNVFFWFPYSHFLSGSVRKAPPCHQDGLPNTFKAQKPRKLVFQGRPQKRVPQKKGQPQNHFSENRAYRLQVLDLQGELVALVLEPESKPATGCVVFAHLFPRRRVKPLRRERAAKLVP